ncbi:MAG TPA: hypothetical protein VLH60_06040 [Sedimentisphaerales bacterium]|nr:hypothetical protein [Sedimentisphaerales bacterium]
MQQDSGNSISIGDRLASYLAVERKKVAAATCLICIMAFMWVRLLTRTGEPAGASAASSAVLPQSPEKAEAISIVYTELPFVAGRNDALTVDCFSPGDWRTFFSQDRFGAMEHQSGESASGPARSRMIQRIAEGLKLQIVGIGSEPQAFISERLVREGSELNIATGDGEVIFRVLRITSRSVELECEGMTFEIKLDEKR